ncbi:MAG: hypothetical protein Kow0092_24350 [Deferrisomatales bacterium]
MLRASDFPFTGAEAVADTIVSPALQRGRRPPLPTACDIRPRPGERRSEASRQEPTADRYPLHPGNRVFRTQPSSYSAQGRRWQNPPAWGDVPKRGDRLASTGTAWSRVTRWAAPRRAPGA